MLKAPKPLNLNPINPKPQTLSPSSKVVYSTAIGRLMPGNIALAPRMTRNPQTNYTLGFEGFRV